MKAQFIFTPEFGDQIFKIASVPKQNMRDKYALMTLAMSKLPIEKQGNIIKISCCVDEEPPQWYNDCNGKIWADDLESWRQLTGMKSTVTPAYLEGFNS